MSVLLVVLASIIGGILGSGSVLLCRYWVGIRLAIRAENRAVSKAKECLKCSD